MRIAQKNALSKAFIVAVWAIQKHYSGASRDTPPKQISLLCSLLIRTLFGQRISLRRAIIKN